MIEPMSSWAFKFGIERPDEIETIFRWKCRFCDAVAELKTMGEVIQFPTYGRETAGRDVRVIRTVCRGSWVCPKHSLEQKVVDK